jgi:hypothetical protein
MMSLTSFPGMPPTRTYNQVIDRITALRHYTPQEVQKLASEGAVYCSPGTAAASS